MKIFEIFEIFCLCIFSGHHILLFLVQTVARQASEQEQYVPNRMASSGSGSLTSKQRMNANRGKSGQTPPLDHEQEPPKFSRLSLSYILKNWEALKSMIMFGCNSTGSRRYSFFIFPFRFLIGVSIFLNNFCLLLKINFLLKWFFIYKHLIILI